MACSNRLFDLLHGPAMLQLQMPLFCVRLPVVGMPVFPIIGRSTPCIGHFGCHNGLCRCYIFGAE